MDRITFSIDPILQKDLLRLIEGKKAKVLHVDCLQNEVEGDLHAALNCGMLTLEQVRFIEDTYF